ncbi:MAG: heavy metal-binding domain-containing protein, partial [Methylomonas sp.]
MIIFRGMHGFSSGTRSADTAVCWSRPGCEHERRKYLPVLLCFTVLCNANYFLTTATQADKSTCNHSFNFFEYFQMPTKVKPSMKSSVYTCPMHPEVRQLQSGSCPKCGMALEQITEPVAESQTEYVCPM